MFKKILIVCVGNICRSPMGEAIFKYDLQQKKITDVTVTSAGIGALVGHPADTHVQEILTAEGIDCSQHVAQQITPTMINETELILVMEEGHRKEIEHMQPSACGKVHLLGKWDNFEIPDPYKKSKSAFEEAHRLIKQSVAAWQAKLWN